MLRTPRPVPPLPPFHVARPRVLDIFDAGADQPLTAVVAPPGAGKSVALAAWVRERCPDAVWVSCEDPDRDPVAFWGSVGAALRGADGERGLEVVELLSESDPDLTIIVDALLRDFERHPTTLLLDDVHIAREAGPLASRFVERLPAGSRVVTGSRGDPPFALHRLRATGRCTEIREADLRLTPDEVDQLVHALGADVSADAMHVLFERTDGWVAGVQMAAIALRSEPEPERFLADFSGSVRIVSDFLVEEVLASQPEEVQQFLLRTSVLDQLEPGACAAVTGHDDAASFLRRLDSSAMFLVATGDDSYRYHHLFRDMLRYQLRATSQDGALDAHRRAAEWYEGRQEYASALTQLLAAGDDDRAYALLQAKLGQVWLEGGAGAVRALVTAVAEGDATLRADRMVAIAVALAMAGALTSADAWLERAGRKEGELDAAGRKSLTVARAYVAGQQGDALRALPLIGAIDPQDEDDDTAVAAPAFEVSVRGWLGDFRGARDAAARTLTLRSLGVVYDEILAGGALSWVSCVEGSLPEAGRLSDRALATAAELGIESHTSVAEPLRTRGRLCFERGDLHAAEDALERALMLIEGVSPARTLVTMVTLARVWLSDGRWTDAVNALAAGRTLLEAGVDSPLNGLLDGLDARIALLEGDRGRAELRMQALPMSARRSRLEARMHLAAGSPDAALTALERYEPATPRERVDRSSLRARADDQLGLPRAEVSLSEAVATARQHGFPFALAEELYPLKARLSAYLHATARDAFSDAVLTLLDRIVPLSESATREALVEPLTEKETVVLRYLASRLTTTEIAKELFVSVNTVRTHAKAVYRKLGVSSRQDAVAEAHRRGIR